MHTKNRKPIEAGYLTAQTALAAKKWGGDDYVTTLAEQGKAAAKTGEVPKPTHMTVQAMAKTVKQAPDAVQEKLKAAIVAGEVTTPGEAEQKGRRLAAERTKRNKLPPPDLHEVIIDWTHRIKDWDDEMAQVAPYMEYLEEAPAIAGRFRAALTHFILTAQQLLESAPAAPRSVGRGQSTGVKLSR